MTIFPIKQLSGYSYWSTIWQLSVATLFLITVSILLLVGAIFIIISEYLS